MLYHIIIRGYGSNSVITYLLYIYKIFSSSLLGCSFAPDSKRSCYYNMRQLKNNGPQNFKKSSLKWRLQFFSDQTTLPLLILIAPFTPRALFVLLLVLLNKLPSVRISYPPSTLPYLASKQMDLRTLWELHFLSWELNHSLNKTLFHLN